MDQELDIISHGSLHKFYFIMRYPDKPKLVYSPITIDFGIIEYSKLPLKIQAIWNERKSKNPPGTELAAVCSLHNCIFVKGEFNSNVNMPAGHLVLTCSVHQADIKENLVIFYTVSKTGVVFYNDTLHANSARTEIDEGIFPMCL